MALMRVVQNEEQEMIEGNVCFFHKQSNDKWTWFIVDDHGRAVIKGISEFDTYGETRDDYMERREEMLERIVISQTPE